MIETKGFKSITLKEMDKVQLMNRVDRKYWFNEVYLQPLLDALTDDYYLLAIGGNSLLPYASTYYETSNNQMYVSHHNGKLNRLKIRRRSYIESKISFLEIKFKNNKGRTIKKRILSEFGREEFTPEECHFISAFTSYNAKSLEPRLSNKFTRLTLVNKNFKERCTIDIDLRYHYKHNDVALENLVIVELKSDGNSTASPLALALRERRIMASGFSKYCLGRCLTDSSIKQNAFKGKIRKIERSIKIYTQPKITLQKC